MPSQYSTESINQEELDLLLEAANWAPNHKRTESWRFRIIQGEGRQKFAQFMESVYLDITAPEMQNDRKRQDVMDKCLKSDKIVLICMKKSDLLPEWEEIAATSMAVQNMWLMCTSMNIGSYWSSPTAIKRMHEFMPMEENETCYGIFYMGKLAGELHESSRRPIEEKVKYMSN